MVLETWATELSIGNHQQMFITQDNPVQRRPKIDYFSNEAVQNMIPIVSHISSNGYYGYCATPAMVPCNSVDNGIDKPSIDDDEKIQMDIQMDIQMVLQPPDDQVNHKLPWSVERRKRCQKFMHDDQVIAMKRCRNQAEIGEGLSLHYFGLHMQCVAKMQRNDRDTKFINCAFVFFVFFFRISNRSVDSTCPQYVTITSVNISSGAGRRSVFHRIQHPTE